MAETKYEGDRFSGAVGGKFRVCFFSFAAGFVEGIVSSCLFGLASVVENSWSKRCCVIFVFLWP